LLIRPCLQFAEEKIAGYSQKGQGKEKCQGDGTYPYTLKEEKKEAVDADCSAGTLGANRARNIGGSNT
jgi:hypothetical protein